MAVLSWDKAWPTADDAGADDRALDVKLVKSTLAWHSARDNVGSVERSARELSWIGPVLRRRFQDLGLTAELRGDGEKTYWNAPDKSAQIKAAFTFGLFVGGGMTAGALNVSQQRWLDHVLPQVPVYGRLKGSERVSVALLNTIERVTAYVMQMLIDNRHELRDSIRVCPFTGRSVPAPHHFLDYRVDEGGNFLRGQVQRFCCFAHQNAFNQAQVRARARAERKRK